MYQTKEVQLEFEASRSAEIIDCLRNMHVVKINNAFADHALLKDLRDAIEITGFFAANFDTDGHSNKHAALQRFHDIKWSREFPVMMLNDVPFADMVVERLLQSSAALRDLLRATFGPSYKRHVAVVRPAQCGTAARRTDWSWHQDKSLAEDYSLTIWFPVTDCGVDAPGLQYFVGDDIPLLPTQKEGKPWWAVRPDAIDALSKTHAVFTPVFSAGDCIVSDGYAVHRTYATELMTKERTSVDIRFTAA